MKKIDFKKWDKYNTTDPNGDEALRILDGLGKEDYED